MSNVLVIDDALFMRQMIKNALEQVGFTIVGEAGNGKEGIALFHELKPDITTLDIVMPEMDGYEATKVIRSKPLFKDIPIIAMTANVMKSDLDKCF